MPELYNWQVDSYHFLCFECSVVSYNRVPPIHGSIQGALGAMGYTNLPVLGCGNFTTTQRNLTVFDVGGVG
jgi:hypothetical protein